VSQSAFELRRNESTNAGPPGRVDQVELFVPTDGRDDDINTLQRVAQVIDIIVVDDSNLNTQVLFEFRMWLDIVRILAAKDDEFN